MSTESIRERPILFSGPMIRALLNGTKTQTRRVVKPQPTESPAGLLGEMNQLTLMGPGGYAVKCPYGTYFDRLWVRETWATVDTTGSYGDLTAVEIAYRSTEHLRYAQGRGVQFLSEEKAEPYTGGKFSDRWRSPIYMPRWASRLSLEITNIRAERLQDITEEDAIAEGCTVHLPGAADEIETAREQYARLWESINGPGSWAENPWVWVVSFKVVTP